MFNPDNKIVKLCIRGMEMEAKGNDHEAADLFRLAWNSSENDFEKLTAAHYLARQQRTVEDKLKWDKKALYHALKTDDGTMKEALPSLYLNIAKCYEDLNDLTSAEQNYTSALHFASELPDNAYGEMILSGIRKGIERIREK